MTINKEHIKAALPQMRTVEDIKQLDEQGYNVRSVFGQLSVRSLANARDRLNFVNQSLVGEYLILGQCNPEIPPDKLEDACVMSSRLALGLILNPTKGVEVCPRNPKLEFRQLARILVQARLSDTPVPFVVPCCPDTNQYRLGDGLGDVVPKGLDHSERLNELCNEFGFPAQFDIHIADVEGRDKRILESSGETTESHFAKTGETIRKASEEVTRRGISDFVEVGSMDQAFSKKGLSYTHTQFVAAVRIDASQDRKVQKTITGLQTERVRLGNFDRFDDQTRRGLVIAELAGYAAYGVMVGGEAVILSPDAKSAIPAYHYSLDQPSQYSPVLYAA